MSLVDRRLVVDILVAALSPYIGGAVARAAVNGNCDKLRIGGRVDQSEIAKLLEALGPGMHVFVGRDKTLQIMTEVSEALRAETEAQ